MIICITTLKDSFVSSLVVENNMKSSSFRQKHIKMDIILFFSIFLVKIVNSLAMPQLQLVNVIFRHGDRTPSYKGRFPTDPNFESDFRPIGYGGLTNAGKLRSFGLGEFLRKRYNTFIGDCYFPDLVQARATESDRTKMSLQLVLAALFPPVNEQKWHNSLNWQPIPISYLPFEQDKLLGNTYRSAFAAEEKRVSEIAKSRIHDFAEFESQLQNLTGKQFTSRSEMKRIYDTLLCEQNMNLTLPDWTKGIFPDGQLFEAALLKFDLQAYDTRMLHFVNGNLISKMTNDMISVKNKKEIDERDTRIYLYSGHDVNVSGILRSLRVYKKHIPYFSNAVIIELFKENDEYYVKVLYYHGNTSQVEELQMPECPELCPFEKYLANVDYLLNFEK